MRCVTNGQWYIQKIGSGMLRYKLAKLLIPPIVRFVIAWTMWFNRTHEIPLPKRRADRQTQGSGNRRAAVAFGRVFVIQRIDRGGGQPDRRASQGQSLSDDESG